MDTYLDFMMDFMKVIFCLLFLVNVHEVTGYSRPSSFRCFSDWCNLNDVYQYCSDIFQFCRNCEAIRDDCGSPRQPLNCTGYCVASAVEAELERRTKQVSSCLVTPMMLNIANGKVDGGTSLHNGQLTVGSNLTFSCDEGFVLTGYDTTTCWANGTWSLTEMPYCMDNTCFVYKRATLGLSVICGALFLALLAVTVYVILRMRKWKKMTGDISRQTSDNSLSKEQQPLMGNEHNDPEAATTTRHDSSPGVAQSTKKEPANQTTDKGQAEKKETTTFTEMRSSSPEQAGTGKNPNVTINMINIMQPGNTTGPQEQSDNLSTQNHGALSNNRGEERDLQEKFPTKESGEDNPLEETAEEKKGTKPLPSRVTNFKQPEGMPTEMTQPGPEVIPPEDDTENLPTKESSSQQISSEKVGIQEITFSRSDIQSS